MRAGQEEKEVSLDEEKKQGSSHLINVRRETTDVTVCIKPLIDFNALFICVNKSCSTYVCELCFILVQTIHLLICNNILVQCILFRQ